MKLPIKLTIIFIIFIGGMLITWQVIDKNKIPPNSIPQVEQPVTDENKDISIQKKVNKDTPDLKGGPESSVRIPNHIPSSAHVFYSSPTRSLKQAALTFDDGPDIYYTSQILDILKKNNIKATFFIVGVRAQAHPDMVRRIVNEGHSIGNHTWDHPILSKLSADSIKDEVLKTEQLLENITGIKTAIFRPPYGAANLKVIDEVSSLGYSLIDWSVDTRDWAGTPAAQIMHYVNSEIYPGGIILQHCAGGKEDNLTNTVEVLPQIITTLKNQGYNFTTVEDLLNIPGSK